MSSNMECEAAFSSKSSQKTTGSPHRRKLLLIYIHGFMGSEESFKDFPRHVHDTVTMLLHETHDVYTKVYPRYKTRGDVSISRDNFSKWLGPHEKPDLDIILLGHSLGGILAAEVALMSSNGKDEGNALKHSILGLVNFDVPFLGLHPRVVPTGIGSLFERKEKEPEDRSELPSGMNKQEGFSDADSRFDPAFQNDVHLAQWKGWDGVRHFMSKYSGHLKKSVPLYMRSFYDHAECMHDYPQLLKRYEQLVELERPFHTPRHVNRVRFVNYFTASTGKVKAIGSKEKIVSESEVENSTKKETDFEKPLNPTEKDTKDQDEKPESLSTQKSSSTISIPNADCSSERTPSVSTGDFSSSDKSSQPTKKLRKFCYVPRSAKQDESHLWVPMVMENMNEVDAHQSMFQPQRAHYERLVSDTAERIEGWIQDDLTNRLLLSGLD